MIEIKDIYGNVIYTSEIDETLNEALCRAVKQGADLRYADIRYADLRYANLQDARLQDADLRYADLRYADLWHANLWCANLWHADLRYAVLQGADLRYADLRYANLRYANLQDARLQDADLRYADLYVPLHCPSHGDFIGWKKVNNCIIKLLIPEDAKRLSATTNKCRCDKAKVLEITDISNGEQKEFIINTNYVVTKYEVGKIVKPDSFDVNRWNECSNGIHFFINKEDAIRY